MRITPAMSFVAEGPNGALLEADLAFFWQESIYGQRIDGVAFAECKTYNKFTNKDFDRMRTIARNFPGAVLIFTTLRKTLEDDERSEMAAVADEGRRYWKSDTPINPVLVLTGTELMTIGGMPNCWDKATQELVRHSPGLINLCNATQQIYLGLSPWHTGWQQNWDKYRPDKRH
jgi:hypothetical protein